MEPDYFSNDARFEGANERLDPRVCQPQKWAMLINQWLDGELDAASGAAVNEHLNQCGQCRQLLAGLAMVDAGLLKEEASGPVVEKRDESLAPRTSVSGNQGGRWWLRWIPLAVAAAVVIGLCLIAFNPRNELTAEEFARPVSDVHVIHEQREREQALQAQVMEMHLRMLRQELSLLSTDDEEQKQRMADSIEQMIDQLAEIKTFSD